MKPLWTIAAVLASLFIGANVRGGAATRPAFDTSEWKTDFTRANVPLGEIQSGGPPKDGIPALDRPRFQTTPDAAKWLKPTEPVIAVERAGDSRAYPLQILIWHEIVNDIVAGTPMAVTFCPLCNTSIVFDRRIDGRTLSFGTTGKLYRSALIMYDRQTESWWWQVSGDAIVGSLAGRRLAVLPSQIISFETFARFNPRGRVLSRETGFRRSYGQNPYQGYDDIGSSPFLYSGPHDPRLPPMERVVTVSVGDQHAAYPFRVLAKVGVVNDTVGGVPVVVLYRAGVTSPLDRADMASSRDVGAVGVFSRQLAGRTLTLKVDRGRFVDVQTLSEWSIVGTALSGPLTGRRLEPVVHGNPFWFAWAAYRPRTRVYAP